MRALRASELLDIWENGLSMPPARRALALLERAFPEMSPQQLLRLPIGRRDACLLDLRERLLGPALVAVASCRACGEQLETTFRSADIRAGAAADDPIHTVETADHRITFRLPTSEDVLAVSHDMDPAGARALLLRRCVLEASHDGAHVDASSLPEQVSTKVAALMATADPQADVELALSCPACAHAWRAPFDISAFFWQEINAWARRMLRSVHVLAHAYGWREADILELSPTRRQIYLGLARQ